MAHSADPLLPAHPSLSSAFSPSSVPPPPSGITLTLTLTLTLSEYEDYLCHTTAARSSTASVTQTSNVFACLVQSSNAWILDSRSSDHISGNKSLFSSLTLTSHLPTVTLANGSQTIAQGVGSTCPIPSLPLPSVLYIPEFPFDLISISKLIRDLHCSLTFSSNFVTLQDRSTRKTIGIGHELQGLFHLRPPLPSTACSSVDDPLLIHHRLGHPSLSKFRLLVNEFFGLSTLECESCQLGKHSCLFPKASRVYDKVSI